MGIGGIVFESIKLIFGNDDVKIIILSFAVLITLLFVSIEIYNRTRL